MFVLFVLSCSLFFHHIVEVVLGILFYALFFLLRDGCVLVSFVWSAYLLTRHHFMGVYPFCVSCMRKSRIQLPLLSGGLLIVGLFSFLVSFHTFCFKLI